MDSIGKMDENGDITIMCIVCGEKFKSSRFLQLRCESCLQLDRDQKKRIMSKRFRIEC